MSVNNVILVGRLTKDPELRKTSSGLSVCSFTVACDRNLSKEKRQDPSVQTADFVRCVAYRGNADFLTQYCHKGTRVSIVGSIQTGSYTDQTGKTVFTTDVLVNNLHSESDRQANANANTQNDYQQNTYQQPQQNYQNNSYNGYQNQQQNQNYNPGNNHQPLDISNDDLPF